MVPLFAVQVLNIFPLGLETTTAPFGQKGNC